MAIYNDYRPGTFDEVKGQDSVVATLKNEVRLNKVGHSHLFVGTRGTGKTTMAKIMAKAVNCLHPKEDGSPCECCENCVSINAQKSMDIMEIDAASNNGVDDVRALIETLHYIPSGNMKKKVYIIDEVHMLSAGAFNALLKTIEEPPETCVFILCTTELHKVPATIQSRCQIHTFKSMGNTTLVENMAGILQKEGYTYEPKALELVAKLAAGSCRDSLSILEQVMLFALDKQITLSKVRTACNLSKTEEVRNTVWYLLNENDKVLEVSRQTLQNCEPVKYIEDVISYLRNVMLFYNFRSGENLMGSELSEEDIQELKKFSEVSSYNNISRILDVLLEGISLLKQSSQKHIMVDIIMCRCIRPQMRTTEEALVERIRMLEEKIDSVETRLSRLEQYIH